ncbi:lipoyl domain-containing protein [Halorubellus salinus]|uniref:lipoyl domain-containing protein n=1 Tax=Halorubellus salinus TaxID=755309 RepID=UPI001D087839|nr:lipoyl domain-containing protein [Halorubellus salinus]
MSGTSEPGSADGRVAVTLASVWPDGGDDVDEGVVANWFAKEGATVDAGDTLCEIQIEKVSIDVPAPVAGTVDEVVLGENDEFTREDTLAYVRPA